LPIRWPKYRGTRRPADPVRPSGPDYGAQAEIEEHDIDQMIEARNDLRRRSGRPEIGDELAAGMHEQLNERKIENS
jgi:hypothetical protein